MKITKLLGVVILGLLLMLASFGCKAQKKPMLPLGQGNPPAPTSPAPSTPLPTAPNESSKLASRLAGEAQKVKGVNKASVVLTGNTAMVGADLKPGANAVAVKSEVGSAVKRADNRIKTVLVSTNPELNQRIIRISQGIAGGKPISSFSNEVKEIIDRLTPTAK